MEKGKQNSYGILWVKSSRIGKSHKQSHSYRDADPLKRQVPTQRSWSLSYCKPGNSQCGNDHEYPPAVEQQGGGGMEALRLSQFKANAKSKG